MRGVSLYVGERVVEEVCVCLLGDVWRVGGKMEGKYG